MIELQISVMDLLLGLLVIGAIILVVFAIIAVYRLGKSMIKLDKILADFEVVSEAASKRTKQLDEGIEKVSKTLSGVSGKMKNGQNVIAVITILANMVGSIAKSLKRDPEKRDPEKKK